MTTTRNLSASLAMLGVLLLLHGRTLAQEAQEAPTTEQEEATPVVENGKQISIEYTLKLGDGTVADSNVGGEPLTYEQGAHQILPALEARLEGMKVNETRHVELQPDEGYGAVDPQAFREIEAEAIPEEAREVGTMLMAQDTAGNRRPVRVHELKGETVVLDFNHPFAGQVLSFDVRILGVD